MATLHEGQVSVEMGDGAQSEITILRVKADNFSPVMLCLPAMGVSARLYHPLALEFVKRGWNAVTADLRGNGQSSVRASRRNNFGYHEMLTHDWPAMVKRVRDLFPNHPLFLLGHSLGGQLSALYLSAHPYQVDGLILVAACSVFYKGWDFPKNLGILLGTKLARVIADIVGYFPGTRLGFGGIEARQVIKDWARNARTGRYEIANSPHRFEELLGEVRTPVLAISFEDDDLAPKRAVQNLCRKLKQAPLTHVHLNSSDPKKKLGHFSWLREPKPIVFRIEEWLNSTAPAQR